MKNNIVLLFIAAMTLLACNGEVDELNYDIEIPSVDKEVTPPGKEYYKEGKACMNVLYCIPNDLDTVADWHRRLSQVTLYAQEFYRKSFIARGYGDKTFNLVKNKDSKDFIEIQLLRLDYASDRPNIIPGMMMSIKDYFRANPEMMHSGNTIVYCPAVNIYGDGAELYHGAYSKWDIFNDPIDNMGFAFLGIDRIELDMNYIGTAAASSFLVDVGVTLHEIGHALWLQHNETPSHEETYGVMGPSGIYRIFNGQDSVVMSASDVMWMNQLEVFQKNRYEDFFTYVPEPNIQDTKLSFEDDSIVVQHRFKPNKRVVGFMVYNDPWFATNLYDDISSNTFTEYDAVSYVVPEDEMIIKDGAYEVKMKMAWGDFYEMYPTIKKGELRFRYFYEGGVTYPTMRERKGWPYDPKTKNNTRYYYNVKSSKPIFDINLEEK